MSNTVSIIKKYYFLSVLPEPTFEKNRTRTRYDRQEKPDPDPTLKNEWIFFFKQKLKYKSQNNCDISTLLKVNKNDQKRSILDRIRPFLEHGSGPATVQHSMLHGIFKISTYWTKTASAQCKLNRIMQKNVLKEVIQLLKRFEKKIHCRVNLSCR